MANDFEAAGLQFSVDESDSVNQKLSRYREMLLSFEQSRFFNLWCSFIQDEDASGGDQDQEERRWNKRTQQMLHGLQVCRHSHQGVLSQAAALLAGASRRHTFASVVGACTVFRHEL